jgi:hypothetical protein
MTDHAEPQHPVMEPFKGGRFQLPEAMRNDSGSRLQRALESVPQLHGQAMHEQVATSEGYGVFDQFFQVHPDGRVVGAHHSAGAGADDGLEWNAVTHERPKHTPVGGAP